MKNKEKFYSTALALTALVFFFLISVLFVASTATAQSASPVGPFAYIATSNGTVSVINTATDTVIASVPVGAYPAGVAVNPDGSRVYVANNGSNNVSVIDTATNTVIASVPVGAYPAGVAVNPDGSGVYVTNTRSNTTSVIDTATNTVTGTVPVGFGPIGVAVTPDGTKVYVTNNGGDSVSVIDTATNTVTATVPVGAWPFGVAVNPDGMKLYVTHTAVFSSFVSIIDTATNTVTGTVQPVESPYGVAVTPDGTKVYVANINNYTLSVIDTATNEVTATVRVGEFPFGVAVTPDGTKVYVTNLRSDNVSVIDTVTNTVTNTVNVGVWPLTFGQFITPETSITVISPNGTENWQAGTSQVIRWKYTGNPGRSVKIELLKGDGSNSIINSITSIGNDGTGSYEWLIPLNQMPGNDYKVRITSVRNSAYNNSSTGNFTISPPPSVCNTSIISGYSFNDSNGNKILDEGENGLPNWTINLNGYDTCKEMPINKTMKTNSAGYFTFEDVNPGAYVLSENINIGWALTTNPAYALNIPSNSTEIRRDFGNSKFVR